MVKPEFERINWMFEALDETITASLMTQVNRAEVCGCNSCQNAANAAWARFKHWENCSGQGIDIITPKHPGAFDFNPVDYYNHFE